MAGDKEWQYVYFDTDHIQDYLWGGPDEQNSAKSLMRGLESSLRRHYLIKVKISFLVVGELINNLLRDDIGNKDHILEKFLDLLRDLNADLVPPPESAYNKAIELRNRDYRVKGVDALIVSQALCDQYSSHFLTSDDNILKSIAIGELGEEMRDSGDRKRKLRITEEF